MIPNTNITIDADTTAPMKVEDIITGIAMNHPTGSPTQAWIQYVAALLAERRCEVVHEHVIMTDDVTDMIAADVYDLVVDILYLGIGRERFHKKIQAIIAPLNRDTELARWAVRMRDLNNAGAPIDQLQREVSRAAETKLAEFPARVTFATIADLVYER